MLKISSLILVMTFLSFQTVQANPNLSTTGNAAFEENKGQVVDQFQHLRNDILYYGNTGGMAYYLKTNGISYQLSKTEGEAASTPIRDKSSVPKGDNTTTTIYRVDILWVGANAHPDILHEGVHEDNTNYYLAQCPDGITGVKSYDGVTYQNLYNGIDLKYYHKDGSLKYDYIVSAGADYKTIQLKIEGATAISNYADGSIVIQTPLGNINEAAPLVLQDGKEIASAWVMHENALSFEIADYDHSKPLIIDPLTRQWGTYIGGEEFEWMSICRADDSGNVYMCGITHSTTGIATTGAHKATMNKGDTDGFLVKFDSTGARLWGTYYGGASIDEANDIAIDNNNCYITGKTSSTTMSTPGAYQTTFGGYADAFLAKFNTSGVRQWATYFGGPDYDVAYACKVDNSGDIIICGSTAYKRYIHYRCIPNRIWWYRSQFG